MLDSPVDVSVLRKTEHLVTQYRQKAVSGLAKRTDDKLDFTYSSSVKQSEHTQTSERTKKDERTNWLQTKQTHMRINLGILQGRFSFVSSIGHYPL